MAVTNRREGKTRCHHVRLDALMLEPGSASSSVSTGVFRCYRTVLCGVLM